AFANPVADMAALGHAMADVGKGDAARELAALAFKDEKGDRRTLGIVLAVAAEAVAPARALEFVRRPSRLPALKEGATFPTQCRPCRVVAGHGHPQHNLAAFQHRHVSAEERKREHGLKLLQTASL